jgi:signal transduction histidine kinase
MVVLAIADRYSPPFVTLPGLSQGQTYGLRLLVAVSGMLAFSAVAGLLLWRQPRNPFSWAFAGVTVAFVVDASSQQYAIHGLLVAPGSLPLADAAARLGLFLGGPSLVFGVFALLSFPNGRLQSRRWWILVAAAAIVFGIQEAAGWDAPFPLNIGFAGREPVPVTGTPELWAIGAAFRRVGDAMFLGQTAIFWGQLVLVVVLGLVMVVRMRRASGESRLQLKWFAYAVGVLVIAFVLSQTEEWSFLGAAPRKIVEGVSLWAGLATDLAQNVLLPVAVAVAMLRYHLYDIDLVINRTILYAGLAGFLTLAYGITVAGIGSLLGQQARFDPLLTILAIGLAALLLEPVRARLQAIANVAVYGKRANPYEVLSDFARGLGRADAAVVLLPRMAELLREGTGAASTEIWVRIGERLQLAASSPDISGPRLSAQGIDELAGRVGDAGAVVPVFQAAELLGALAVRKARGDTLNAVERRLLNDLASQAGLVFQRFRLVEELRESRSRIVAAQDLERRRIERNLHDGAQQRFVNALLALGMAQATSPAAPSSAMLKEASREVQAGLSELRDLARGLHPPLLTESGLHAAVASLADRSPIVTSVVAATDHRYPEPVEVTAYYVVAEALTNAAKHSSASALQVRIEEANGRLRIEVADDGVGGADVGRGSGLVGLQDRAAAIGGTLTVRSTPGHGTVVRADLPCA